MAKNSYLLTIGEVAAEVPCNRNTVLAKEKQGVVQSQRIGANRQRVFTLDAPERIRKSLARNRKTLAASNQALTR